MASRIETPQLVFQSDDSVMKNSSGKHWFTPVTAAGQTSINLVPADTTLFPDGKIPSWATEIVLIFSGISTNGTSRYHVRIGDSGGISSSGYLGTSTSTNINSASVLNTTGFGIRVTTTAADVYHGIMEIKNLSGNTWVSTHSISLSNTEATGTGTGSKTLINPLEAVRFTTSGLDTFDAGTIGGYFR